LKFVLNHDVFIFSAPKVGQSSKLVPMTKGEIGLDALPPIEDLTISVAEQECMELGKISAIVDKLSE